MNTTADFLGQLIAELGIGPAETGQRFEFLEFGPDDIAALKGLHAQIEARNETGFFVDEFYRHLLNFEQTRAFMTDPEKLAHLKRTQAAYFHDLTLGKYDADYVHYRLRVGVVHERIGLDPKWYIGAYRKYLSFMLPKVAEIYRAEPDRINAVQQALIKIILFDMGLAIDTYMYASQQSIRKQSAQLAALSEIAVTLTSSLDLTETLNQIMDRGMALSGAMAACVAFCDPVDWTFKEWTSRGLSDHFVNNMAFRPGGLADETFTTNTYILSNDQPQTKHQLSLLARAEGIKSFICLPLTSHSHRLGVIYFYHTDRDSFAPAEIDLLGTFARLAAHAIQNARLATQTSAEARLDPLTSLLNRRSFDRRHDEEHRRAKRYTKPYALMMIDIDHFKRVNDEYGHPAGDAVLKSVGKILSNQFRDVDIVARYGGEEFIVLLPEISGSVAKDVGERVRLAMADAIFSLPDGQEIRLTISIGVSCFPNCAPEAAVAISTADQALYTAKQEGRNRVLLYRETLKARLEKQPELLVEMLLQATDNMTAVVTAISNKSPYLRQHATRTEKFTARLAQALNLPPDEQKVLQQAALLHDIGMLIIPDGLLDQTTPLREHEWKQIHQHPITAAEWLARVPALERAVPIVRHHHERVDGKGYPDGLCGQDIPYLARILAVTDSYAAMLLGRPGQPGLNQAEVIERLRSAAGTQFDPEIVEQFVQVLESDTTD